MIKQAIARLVEKKDLTKDEAVAAMDAIMSGEATPAQIGAFLTALHLKGETVDEIVGFASVMRSKVLPVPIPSGNSKPVIDTCGTGGDGACTFNISTTAAFVAAGAGALVAKHGNRAASSRCGSADVLEALGVNINLKPEQVTECLSEAGIAFMFAPLFHPSMKHAGPVRREIGIRTVFNFLGPLTNPAGATRQVLGVPSRALAAKIASALQQLDFEHVLIVSSADGLDEISVASESYLYEVKRGQNIQERTLTPEEVGIPRHPKSVMDGGSAEDNRLIFVRVLKGDDSPQRDVVLLNAAAALYVAGLAGDLREGVTLARRSLDDGAAYGAFETLVKVSQAFV
jgi:anthranilate phosphoribosyltransferase